jgi:hypothetical protein
MFCGSSFFTVFAMPVLQLYFTTIKLYMMPFHTHAELNVAHLPTAAGDAKHKYFFIVFNVDSTDGHVRHPRAVVWLWLTVPNNQLQVQDVLHFSSLTFSVNVTSMSWVRVGGQALIFPAVPPHPI